MPLKKCKSSVINSLKICSFFHTGDLCASEKVLYSIRYEPPEPLPRIANEKLYFLAPDGQERPPYLFRRESHNRVTGKTQDAGTPRGIDHFRRNKVFVHAEEKGLNRGRCILRRRLSMNCPLMTNGFRKIFDVQGSSPFRRPLSPGQ